MREEGILGLAMAEKRDLIERITELVKNDILNKGDRDNIFRVCLMAGGWELAKLNATEKTAGDEPAVTIIRGRSPVSGW